MYLDIYVIFYWLCCICICLLFTASCPSDCSGHGNCATLKDLSLFRGVDYDNSIIGATGDGIGSVYSNWDAVSVTICECDAGYFGPDCSLRKFL